MKRIQAVLTAIAMLLPAMSGVRAHAAAALLMEEPYGVFGGINPTGHVAVYLNHVCAESPTVLRMCRPGETGVVISRYNKVGGYDWLAVPLVPYLYAVEQVDDVPSTADAALVANLRDAYWRSHLMDIVPNREGENAIEAPKGSWVQLVGASYDRKIYGFEIETTREADERFVAEYNDSRNESHFNLFFHNCADFSKALINLYYPHAIRRNFFVDFGITTPKQVARALTNYAKKHPGLEFSTFVIPQVPGSIHRSHHVDGVLEAMLKSKKYVIPLAVFSPQVTAGMIVVYLVDGRFSLPKDGTRELLPGQIPAGTPGEPAVAATNTETAAGSTAKAVDPQPVAAADPPQPHRAMGATQ